MARPRAQSVPIARRVTEGDGGNGDSIALLAQQVIEKLGANTRDPAEPARLALSCLLAALEADETALLIIGKSGSLRVRLRPCR